MSLKELLSDIRKNINRPDEILILISHFESEAKKKEFVQRFKNIVPAAEKKTDNYINQIAYQAGAYENFCNDILEFIGL